MNIIIRNEYRAEVLLTDDELNELDITYEELDYGNVETRRVLWLLLDEIRKRYNTDIDLSGKLLIEVCKEPEDKCRICFTSLPHGKNEIESVRQLVKNCTYPAVVECGNLDDTVSVASKIKFEGKSTLYTDGKHYRLFVFADAGMKPLLYTVMGEYGVILNNINGSVLAVCEEMWQLIEETQALEKLRLLE